MNRQKIIDISKGLLAGVLLAGGLTAIAAWSEPSSAPTSGNIDAPINVSNTGQSKGGNLVVNANNQSSAGLLVPFGTLIVGDSNPNFNLKVDVKGDTGSDRFCNGDRTKCFSVTELCQKFSQIKCDP